MSDEELEREAREAFASGPQEFRERVLREGDAVGQRVASHAVQILIGPSAQRLKTSEQTEAEVNTATGVVFQFGIRTYLATAAHVLDEYAGKVSSGEAIFQAGN